MLLCADDSFNESRGRNPGNTIRAGHRRLSGRAFNESRGRNPGNTTHPNRRAPRLPAAFNESRGRNPGNTRHVHSPAAPELHRSMRAGVGTPATPGSPSVLPPRRGLSFNESRGRNPGNTPISMFSQAFLWSHAAEVDMLLRYSASVLQMVVKDHWSFSLLLRGVDVRLSRVRRACGLGRLRSQFGSGGDLLRRGR